MSPQPRASDEPGVLVETADFSARSMASEALQATRSLEKTNDIKFEVMTDTTREIKEAIIRMNNRLESGFKSYDAKFWSLAITLITLLLTAVGGLVYAILTHGVRLGH